MSMSFGKALYCKCHSTHQSEGREVCSVIFKGCLDNSNTLIGACTTILLRETGFLEDLSSGLRHVS